MTEAADQTPVVDTPAVDDDATIERVLASDSAHASVSIFGARATSLHDDEGETGPLDDSDGEQFDRQARASLRVGFAEHREHAVEQVLQRGVVEQRRDVRAFVVRGHQ